MAEAAPKPGAMADEEPHRRRRRTRRPAPMPRPTNKRARLRFTYFAIAAAWGFMIGAVAILGAVSFMDIAFRPDGTTGLVIAGAAVMAIAGGLVTARAYRDASSRGR